MKQVWLRRPGAVLFLLISYGLWGAVTLRWITVFVEQRHPYTWAISSVLLLFGLLMGLEPLLTRGSAGRVHVYLVFQTGIIFLASLFHYELDFFALLYVPLCGQAMALLPRRAALGWLGLLVAVTAVGQTIQFGGPEAISFTLLYAAGLIFVAAFTAITLEADAARQRSDRLLAELQDAHAQLQAYAHQAEELAIANERNRLARDLHDSVAQTLYGLTLQAAAAGRKLQVGQPAAAQTSLAQIQASAQQTLQETRLLIFELRPPLLASQGLPAALRARLEAVEGRSGVTIHLDLPETAVFPPTVETNLYRVALEALNNIVRHAQAREIWLTLALADGRVRLTVADDGVGFTPTAVPGGGLGLAGMAERVAQMNGRFTLHSAPGEGTQIQVEVPL